MNALGEGLMTSGTSELGSELGGEGEVRCQSEAFLDHQLDAYDYELPESLIAQTPVEPRDQSRLLVVDTPVSCCHSRFERLVEWLCPGDLLVLNDTRVLPARLYGVKPSGGRVEVLLLEEQQPQSWLALVKPGRRLPVGTLLFFGDESLGDESEGNGLLQAEVLDRDEATGGRILRFTTPDGAPLQSWLNRLGHMPLPPYITDSSAPPERYQTVYGQPVGSAAAPTAGLHFTPELLARLQAHGVGLAFLTLHVGVGTFRPVVVRAIATHQMHSEWMDLSPQTVEQIRQTQAQGGRIIAVGTTTVRSLESAAQSGSLQPFRGKTDLFIYPGYRWRVVDGLITNFHLPRSSLMMMLSALVGRERLLALYEEAIAHQYRFFSFGDAMLILPEARRGLT